ncbi:hypothetical protein [Lysinibacillus xylanilyticus]|uniref:hypothetical protein n=1 Tax=Lysinibacillus xylanilyticus TaxID=582475 RepID=UPI00381E903F
MNKKIYSYLSVLFLILMISPLVAGDEYFLLILDISIFLPIIWGVLGVFFGTLGVKGLIRVYIVVANLFVLLFYILMTFIGIYGFQQP